MVLRRIVVFKKQSWRSLRERVLDRDGYACRFCEKSDCEEQEDIGQGLSAHHIIPRSDGGRDHESNLITVCNRCHMTLEHTHAKGMSELKEQHMRDTESEENIEHISHQYHNFWGLVDRLDNGLKQFHDGHPTFSHQFSVYDEGGANQPAIKSMELEPNLLRMPDEVSVSSEWEFAVLFGYKEAVLDVLCNLDEYTSTSFPVEQRGTDE